MVDRSVEVELRAKVSDFKRDINDAAVTTDRLDARLAAADDSLDQLGQTSKRTGKDVEGMGTSTRTTRGEVEKLTTRLAQQTRALETERATLKGLRGELRGASGDTSKLTRVIADQEKTVQRHEDSVTRVAAALRGYSTASRESGLVTQSLINDNEALSASARKTESDLDKVSTRVKLYLQAAAVGVPALVAIGAVGGPAIASLTSLLVAGGAGALTLAAALVGVADATKAIDAYQLDPTVENLQKAQDALRALPDSAAAFVMAFQDFQPTLNALRESAANGAMPGLIDTLENAKELAPEVSDYLLQVGRAAGDAAADSSASLASDRWSGLFDYWTAEAPGKLTALTRIVGDLGHGLGQLIMDMDPGSDSATAWIGGVADNFDRWATSDKGRQDVQAFLDYARENGPEVQDFFVSLVDTAAQLVQAAAPLGGPVLTILTNVLDVFASVADSDIGTPILAGAAALSVYNRALAVTQRLQQSPLGQKTGMFGGVADDAAMGAKSAAAADKLKTRVPAVRDFGNALLFAAHSNETLTKSQASGSKIAASSATNALRARKAVTDYARDAGKVAAPVAKAGAAVAGLALISSGAADDIGLTNTASLALMGTMAGPYGAAIGAATGMVMDITAANDGWVASQEAVNASYELSTGAFAARAAALRDMRDEVVAQSAAEANMANYVSGDGGLLADPKDSLRTLGGLLGDDGADQAKKYRDAAAAAREADEAVAGLAASMNHSIGPIDGSARSAAELDAVLAAAQPAMDALGISQQRLIDAYGMEEGPFGGMAEGLAQLAGIDADGPFSDLTNRIRAYIAETDSAEGRSRGVRDAIAGLGDEAVSTADSAAELSTALEALLGPNMDLEAATDGWTTSLRTLSDDLAENSRQLEGNSNGAITNRAALRSRVGDLTGMIKAEAAAGAGPEKLTRSLATQRNALVKAGAAAGLNRGQVQRLLNTYGLTPKLIRTTFRQLGVSKIEQDTRNLRDQFQQLPKDLRTQIREQGSIPTRAKVRQLVKDYGLTEKQRTALITLIDQASGKTKAAQALLNRVDKTRPNPTATLNDQISSRARAAQAAIDAIRGKSVTITTYMRTLNISGAANRRAGQLSGGADGGADGGIHGEGRPYAGLGLRPLAKGGGYDDTGQYFDRIPQVVTGGRNILWAEPETRREAYISDKPGMADRNLQILDQAASWFGAEIVRRGDPMAARVDDYMARLQPAVDQFANGGTRGGRGDGAQLFGARPGGGRGGGGGGGGTAARPDLARAEVRAIVDRIADKFDKSLSRNAKALRGATGEKRKDLLEKREDILRDRWKASAEAIKKETQQRKDLTDSIASYTNEVAGAYQHDLFGNGLAGFQLQADADTNDANSVREYLNKARSNGLNGALFDALAASGDVNTASQFAGLDAAGIAREQARFAGRQTATTAVGTLAADQRFGAQLDEQNRVITLLTRELADFKVNAGKNVRAGAQQGAQSGTHSGTAKGGRDNDRKATQQVRVQSRAGGRRRKGR